MLDRAGRLAGPSWRMGECSKRRGFALRLRCVCVPAPPGQARHVLPVGSKWRGSARPAGPRVSLKPLCAFTALCVLADLSGSFLLSCGPSRLAFASAYILFSLCKTQLPPPGCQAGHWEDESLVVGFNAPSLPDPTKGTITGKWWLVLQSSGPRAPSVLPPVGTRQEESKR